MIQRPVLFGASGHLTSRLLMPAIAELVDAGSLPSGFDVVGASTTGWSSEEFRDHIAGNLDVHAPQVSAASRQITVSMLDYRQGDATDAHDVATIVGDDHPPTLVYLALPPPSLIEATIRALAALPLRGGDTLAIEKPFGTDLASARHLNALLRTLLPAPAVFRIDHFLSSELVRTSSRCGR